MNKKAIQVPIMDSALDVHTRATSSIRAKDELFFLHMRYSVYVVDQNADNPTGLMEIYGAHILGQKLS